MVLYRNTPEPASFDTLLEDSQQPLDYNKILSEKERNIFEVINLVVICGIGAIFGIVGNIINVIIFLKQGFHITVNIAFLGLAISDLCCLLTIEWMAIILNPLLFSPEVSLVILDVIYLSAAWPNICFCRITGFITVYITAERYISITLPLKVKQLITQRRTTLFICLIYLVNLITLIPEYSTSYLDWKLIPEKNLTLVALFFTSSRQKIEGTCYAVHSLLSTTAFLGVILFTSLLVAKLRQSSKWRKTVISNKSQSESMSSREHKTVKMVVFIASVLIICYTPGAIFAMVTYIVGPKQFSMLGGYINVCVSAWSFACCFQALNSSVNIFLYYKMSSKYRKTFHDIIWNNFSRSKLLKR